MLLNESAPTLDSQLIRYRLQDLFMVIPNGRVRFPHTDVVVTISENDPVVIGPTKFPRIESFTNSVVRRREEAEAFALKLKQAWIAFNGGPYVGLVGTTRVSFHDEITKRRA